jgi:Alpha and gamma adaptin binding protein p34
MSAPLSVLRVIGPDPSVVDSLRACLAAHFPPTAEEESRTGAAVDPTTDGGPLLDGSNGPTTKGTTTGVTPAEASDPTAPESIEEGSEAAATVNGTDASGRRVGLSSALPAEATSSSVMRVTNRYFTATVQMPSLLDPVRSSGAAPAHKEDGVLLVLHGGTADVAGDGMDVLSSSSSTALAAGAFDALSKLHDEAESRQMAGDLLRLCVAITIPSPEDSSEGLGSGGGTSCGNAHVEAEYSRRVLWCLDRGYEYVEVDLSAEGVRRGHDERDKDGFARVAEAISTTVWSSARMHRERRSQLRSSYEVAKDLPAHASGDPGAIPMTKDGGGHAGTLNENNNTYEPPTDLHDREALARQSLLLGIDPQDESAETDTKSPGNSLPPLDPLSTASTSSSSTMASPTAVPAARAAESVEERKQDMYFDQFEGALREAGKIREMSRTGELSDEDRRRRAGDAAMLLMDLMSKMGGGLDESGSDTEGPASD